MSHAVKVEVEMKDKALVKAVAKKLGFTVTEQGGALIVDVKGAYRVPLRVDSDGSVSYDRSYDCHQAGNNIQKFVTEYTTEYTIKTLKAKGLNAFRGKMVTDKSGNMVQTLEVM